MPTRSSRRDRIISSAAVAMVLILAAAVVAAVLDAERNGRKALESLQLSQVEQLAREIDSAIVAGTGPLLQAVNQRPWNLDVNDPADLARLEQFQQANPAARAGYLVVNRDGIVTNGTLLTSPSSIGSRLNRPGLAQFLTGDAKFVILSVAPGLTTPLPTIATAVRISDGRGGAAGAFITESEVAADSAFSQVIDSLRRGQTDVYSFIDNSGLVAASSSPAELAHRAAPALLDPRLGLHRHGTEVVAIAAVPHAGWRVAFRERTSEFEGKLTGPLRSALLLLIVVALLGGGLMFFALVARLRAAREEQRRLQAINEAREEFISIVSHELRTPATGQLGFLQTALDHWDQLTDGERRQTVTQAFTNARRLHALTRDVLDTASIEAGELPYAFEIVDLVPAVQAAIDALPGRDNRTLSVTGTNESLPVRADPERIQQVLANVLDNAMKNSPTGSSIEVGVATVGTEAMVEVSDRGMGMTKDELGRVFEKFSRGRNVTVQGTGLGLYICRKIMDAHGGRIWASARPGGGTTVTFALKLLSVPSEGTPSEGAPSEGPPGEGVPGGHGGPGGPTPDQPATEPVAEPATPAGPSSTA